MAAVPLFRLRFEVMIFLPLAVKTSNPIQIPHGTRIKESDFTELRDIRDLDLHVSISKYKGILI